MLIHTTAEGLYPVLSLETSAGKAIASKGVYVDIDPERPDRTLPSELGLSGAGIEPVRLTVGALPPRKMAGKPALRDVRLVVRVGSGSRSRVLTLGQSVALPGGQQLRYAAMRRYARLSIADDWSVYPIYALFGLAAAGLALALLVPYRCVRVMLVSGVEGAELRGLVRSRLAAPDFAGTVEEAIASAVSDGAEKDVT
jgi:hypothetical protein